MESNQTRQQSGAIHPLAEIAPGAKLGAGVRVGPFCAVGPDVVLHDGVELISHVVVTGATTIGSGTRVHPQAVLGGEPQNLRHKGGRTTLTIGRNCLIREAATMHVGSDNDRGATSVGDNCMLMAYAHVAHDCVVGNDVVLSHSATLGGHSEIGDGVIIGGLAAVHQFVRVGHHAFVGGMSAVVGDVIPFGMAVGNRAKLRGLNVVGLKRSGAKRQELTTLRAAYQMLFDRAKPVVENVGAVREAYGDDARVAEVLDFITNRKKRIFCVPPVSEVPQEDEAVLG
ncbi:MAG: acyl-ACP--UDP-N-acetylglucosamine O-acyltransferase [Rhizobiaceae bacterium]|nr:acyl-ACP--UDP-N-acetylglucosamine O-acyltransferase [Rhizobiaceae bacterium]